MKLPHAIKRAPSPLAVLIDPDGIGAAQSARHLQGLGFGHILHLAHPAAPDLNLPHVTRLPFLAQTRQDLARALGQVFHRAAGKWVYWGFAGEALHFPHDDSRKIQDYLAFLDEETHSAAPSLLIDLYPKHQTDPLSDPDNCWFDSTGYYCDPAQGHRRACYGGLRHRMGQHLPAEMQILNRPRLFRAGRIDWDEDLGTPPPYRSDVDVPPSCCVLSWRAAMALQTLPSAAREGVRFHWPQSQAWQGNWRALPPLGLMHLGKWF